MKTRECPSCAMEVDAEADTCPVCGYEFPRQPIGLQVLVWIMIILVLFWLLF